MVRYKSDKPNVKTVTIRLSEKYLSDLNLYAQAVGKNRSEILRLLVIEALEAIPEHTKQVMSIISQSRQGDFISDAMVDDSTKSENFIE
ncbi:ribbon-helix-helix protein, CopG family (plasmid) [Nostoc sp. UHCC 0302]|uniref:ribbon-helix-helix protein, CopG family n=1 Tax=Nostoc sp. UHCC 0302 TaxID=3134896 RepID=UPI00311CB511